MMMFFFSPLCSEESRVFARAHKAHKRWSCTSFERKEKVGKVGVYLFLNAKKVSRVRYYVCVCVICGGKREIIMKRKMSVFVCLSFSL